MPIGIRPINDYAFKKVFGTQANQSILISLLNAILDLDEPITQVTIENPFNPQDFQDDKLSILDIRASDQSGRIFDVEIQLSSEKSLVERLVFYGCEIYSGQMKSGDPYGRLKAVFCICLVDGVIWKDSAEVHHAFMLTDRKTGRTLNGTLAIHTLELGKYNIREGNLGQATLLDDWLFWLIHAQDYEESELFRLFPMEPIRRATRMIQKISEMTEDKLMYDLREKALRDRQWLLELARRDAGEEARREGLQEGRQAGLQEGRQVGLQEGRQEGSIESEIQFIHKLQVLLGKTNDPETDLRQKTLEQLRTITDQLLAEVKRRS